MQPVQVKGEVLRKPRKGPERDPEFARRFCSAMEDSGWKPGKLAKAEEVVPGTVSAWRSGERPDELRLPRLADRFGVSLQWLKTGGGPRERAGTLVVGENRYATPYGASVRESFDKMDFSKLPPEDIANFAAVEVAEADTAGRAMDPKRILWWIDRAYEAGQRSVQKPGDKQRGAG